MICGHCKERGINLEHVRGCSNVESAIRSIGAVRQPVSEDGIYYKPDSGEYAKVLRSQEGRLYAKVWDPDTESWDYAPGLLRLMFADQKVNEHTAGLFGDIYGRCVFCSRVLTADGDGESIERGYGPVCAAREGLPWGPDTQRVESEVSV